MHKTLRSRMPLTETARERFQRNETYAGMASFAGGGPPGTHCAACAYFYSARSAADGRCLKYQQLMRQPGKTFPAGAVSCQYYQAARKKPLARG